MGCRTCSVLSVEPGCVQAKKWRDCPVKKAENKEAACSRRLCWLACNLHPACLLFCLSLSSPSFLGAEREAEGWSCGGIFSGTLLSSPFLPSPRKSQTAFPVTLLKTVTGDSVSLFFVLKSYFYSVT